MLNVTASPLHFKDALIRFAECKDHGFWELVIHQDQDEFTRGLRVFLTRAQLESMRDQLNALLPVAAQGHPLNISDALAAARQAEPGPHEELLEQRGKV